MKYDYGKAMSLSIKFYDAQRSGRLPANNPIPWRSNSAVNDNGDGHDLSGGWYDAGDHVKFNLPMAWSSHVLTWGLEKFKDAYESAGQLDMMYDMVKWPLEYFMKCWEPSKQQYWVQVGDGHKDHSFWGRPEDMHMDRPAFKITAGSPGSDVAGTTVAALASGYIVFKDKDATFAAKCLENAKSLYTFAKAHPGIYSNSVPQAKDFYGSSSWKDNMCEAAVELYKATQDSKYLSDAKGWFNSGTAWGYSWDDQNVGCQLLLWEATQEATYKTSVEAFVKSYMPGGSVPYTPCGLAWRDQWGANRYAANAAFVAVTAAADGIGGDSYKKFAMSQMNYILGDNNKHMSYEIGFGSNFPKKPHHRGASCTQSGCVSDGQDSPHQLDGAMVGGPGRNDDYQDNRQDYVKNEVACDYNAGFHSANAGLYHFAVNNQLPPSPPAKC
ncbi:endoglucanase A-like [Mytilus californianus]|uniref:endoglucanase A-like n=1 Tax=Mytilus californianus TaxID=6549 RepID=UPI0022458664|nr:endoglucanase A-like [Mytilus californianus]